ncbi:MAG TPA: VTT domain-containing protein [Chthoniobacterales bacterium]
MNLDTTSAVGLFLLTFVSEDAATLGGAALSSLGRMSPDTAFLACVLGIWLGDLGLFLLARNFGRPILERLWLRKAQTAQKIKQSETWFARFGGWALVLCRFVPGSRLPTFATAGLLRMPVAKFTAITAALAVLWVGLVFGLVRQFGAAVGMFAGSSHGAIVGGVVAIALGLLAVCAGHWGSVLRRRLGSPRVQRWVQWEFWPAWLFYLPIGANYVRLALKYGGFNVPTCANPGMFTGGLIGESKFATLADLQRTSPEWTANSFLLAEGGERLAHLEALVASGQLSFPFVLKPDVAQRGSGFKVVRSMADAGAYLSTVDVAIVAQEYIRGPQEIGIFYYRLPHEHEGRIFAITEKIFPVVFGDGRRTLEELILADARAVLLADVYLRRFASERARVPAFGEAVRLVEAGNHAQGCIFQDGMHLWSAGLERRIDDISRALPGFFIGRYDVRFESVAELQSGGGFSILELNGAASEATSAYDARKSLGEAYRLLFQQWELVFAIGAANRRAGHRADSLGALWTELRRYRQRSTCHPLAD